MSYIDPWATFRGVPFGHYFWTASKYLWTAGHISETAGNFSVPAGFFQVCLLATFFSESHFPDTARNISDNSNN